MKTPKTNWHTNCHHLKEVELHTGIKADNLRQRIARGTIKATKIGRDWFVSDRQLLDLIPIPEYFECPNCGGNHVEENECEATNGKMD